MNILRTRFKQEIVSEFLPPVKKSNKVIIICTGMPGYPGRRNELLEFLSNQGYWVFLPRYRGSWESEGQFMRQSPHMDILDIIDELPKGFTDLWNKKRYRIPKPIIYVIGSSFGGPAAILSSLDKRVKKAIALSSVIDWLNESKEEPIDWIGEFTASAFGQGYRFSKKDWGKLKTGTFYSPKAEREKLDGQKLLLFHALDDEIVYYPPVKDFAKITGAKLVTLKTGGHLGASVISLPRFWRKISDFLKS